MAGSVRLIHISVPLNEPFRISSGSIDSKESILVRIEKEGKIAWGEASPITGAIYSEETPESTLEFLENRIVPAWIETGMPGPGFVSGGIEEKGSNRFAWAGMEGALWDLESQMSGRSFREMLGVGDRPIESGLAIGIYESIEQLLERCRFYLEEGYKRLKIKIAPGWDLEPLAELKKIFPSLPLMVDANAAYRREHFQILERLDDFDLLMIEQPLPREDLSGHAELQSRVRTPVCLDESAGSLEKVKEAIRLKACRIVNIKIQRVGGLAEAKNIHDLCAAEGIANWMGTMPELGIASLHALYLAALPNFVFPTDVESSRRWYAEDIIDPGIQVEDGILNLPEPHLKRPHVNEAQVEKFTIREKTTPI